jgi:site-specific recombinase XerD
MRVGFVGVQTRRLLLKYKRTLQDGEGPLFRNRGGHRMGDQGMRMVVERAGWRAGVQASMHDLRRSFATMALRGGMQLPYLQSLMGHSALSTTLTYIRYVEDDLRQAHEQYGPVDRFLR